MCELGRLAGLVSAGGGDPARPAPDLAPLDDPARRALLALQVAPCFPGNPKLAMRSLATVAHSRPFSAQNVLLERSTAFHVLVTVDSA